MASIRSLTAFVVLAAVAGAAPAATCGSKSLLAYPIPAGMTTKDSFSVNIRSLTNNGTWLPLGTYLANLNQINTTTGGAQIKQSSMAYFDFCDSVEVSVTSKRPIKSAVVRPVSYGVVPTVQGNTIKFVLTQPRNLVIQVDDDIFDVLHLLSNNIDTGAPSPNDPGVIYYGPGIHNVAGGTLSVPSGKTVYIAGGGVLTASILFANVTGAALRGRGVLFNTPTAAVTVAYSKDIAVDGVTSLNPRGAALVAGEAKNLKIRNLRSFSSVGWGDGIDLFCCQDTLVDSVFMRNSDDCIALYQHRNDWYGNSRNITIQDSSLWADVAHPITMGTHGNTADPETMDGVTIKNIDVLDHREFQMLYQGTIAINVGDSNLIRNVHIEDVRVEDFRLGQLINMRVMFNTKYNTSPGRGIENVTIKNLNYKGTHASPSVLLGYDETRTIKGVTFQNLLVNGLQITDTMRKPAWYLTSDYVPMHVNDHVKSLSFVP